MMNKVKTDAEIQAMRTSGQILAQVLTKLRSETKAGMTTAQLAKIAGDETKRLGGDTPTLGFEGYPAVICISVNDEVVHGIPSDRVLNDGDVIKYDHCVGYNGLITDAAITVVVGQPTAEVSRLLQATQAALVAGIGVVRDGAHIQDISKAVEGRLKQAKLGVVEALCGHGVGHSIHEDPEVPNFDTGSRGLKLKAGMTIAIEPMATLGGKDVKLMPDNWTYSTTDGSLAAQFEHTVLVTENGCEILTASKAN
jgi:methionyl aminopeptidase